jgi:PTH1 family peptidyl-tRNA hydrolase
MSTEIDLIVGLGNPGPDYQTTRHTGGFWFADLLAREHGGRFASERKLKGDTAEIRVSGRRIRLLKPTTYMNESGQSVQAAVSYYKIPIERVLVAYDELDFPPGRVQLRFDGSSAGHNGIGSVIEHVGTKFWRLRIGVGHPRDRAESGRREVIGHVLERASAADEALILEAIGDAVKLVPTILEHGAERAKNRLHRKRPEADGTAESDTSEEGRKARKDGE